MSDLVAVDTHCHLDYLERRGFCAEEIVQQARDAGIHKILTIATTRGSWSEIERICGCFENVWGVMGIHPNHVGEPDNPDGLPEVDELVAMTKNPKVVALGETGLDAFRSRENWSEQTMMFERHLEAARQTGLPLVIHNRNADDEILSLLNNEARKAVLPKMVFHCFSSGRDFAERLMALDCYVGVGGIVTYPKNQHIRDALAVVPVERLVLETDAPFLAPQTVRGKTNFPAYAIHTLNTLALVLNLTPEETARVTTRNAHRLFFRMGVGSADGQTP